MQIEDKERGVPVDADEQQKSAAISGHGQVDAVAWVGVVEDGQRQRRSSGRGGVARKEMKNKRHG